MLPRVLLGMLILGLTACSGGTPSSVPAPSPSAPPAAMATPSAATAHPLPTGIEAAIKTGASPEGVLAAFGSIWVSDHRPGTLTRIDPSNNSVVATVDIGGGHIDAPYEVDKMVWTVSADASKIVIVDPATNAVAGSIDCACEGGGFTWVAGVLWFSGPDDMWWRIDPTALKVTAKRKGVALAASIVVGDRWFGIDDARVLYEFAPRTGKTIRTSNLKSDLGSGTLQATVVGSTIWFSTNDGTISRYDVTAARSSGIAKLDLSKSLSDRNAPVPIAVTGDAIYLRPRPEVIVHLDAATGQVVRQLENLPSGQYQSYITVAYASLWVPNFSAASIWRFDLAAV